MDAHPNTWRAPFFGLLLYSSGCPIHPEPGTRKKWLTLSAWQSEPQHLRMRLSNGYYFYWRAGKIMLPEFLLRVGRFLPRNFPIPRGKSPDPCRYRHRLSL